MAKLFFCLLCLVCLTSQAQFHVLEARNATLDGQEIASKDSIPNSGIIKVIDGGFLSLIHRSGKSLELSGSGEILLDSLGWSHLQTDMLVPYYNERLYHGTGAVEAGLPEMTSPFQRETFRLQRNGSVCLWWKTWRPYDGKFTIVFSNLFDEPIANSITVSDTHFLMDLSEIQWQTPPFENILIVYVRQQSHPFAQVMAISVRLTDEPYILPDYCEPRTATEAIMTAYYLDRGNLTQEAMSHYEKATELSEERVFQDILAKAKTRLNRE